MPFEPGKSGNPGGQRRTVKETRRLAADESPASIRRLAEIRDTCSDPHAVVAACKIIIEQGCGKPPVAIHKTITRRLPPREMSLDQIRQRMQQLEAEMNGGTAH